ncbi:probable G-protein coupled receptor Mth-like 1 [Strongylocentrotus purpuratus]|uniref:G-protein coupled receptors family 2 profile 2 domain-containing protein n=1 Tax=Strongylocentrotus purpuratus TaxID=7668 RepID=A0A7M7N6U5_STRPU|nr:probable G-protein coupled receptor Mth-like 1 [Strongylocentrotus purpuratus]|eukprot:XP_003731409.1 PREDICTED: probable G-protein coupled receptor Mth-like 1 [Strongylocentrotus purpuratus]
MNALAIDLNRTFGSHAKFRVGNKSQIFYIWYSLYAWGIPALIVGACLVIDLCECTNLHFIYGNRGLCWLSSGNANLFAFGVPLAALLFLNAILFTDTVVGIRLTKKAAKKALKERPALAKAKEELSLYIKLSGVMGFTWILAFVCEYANIPELWYIFTAINSLQGVFILLAFGFNKRIIAMWKEKLGVRPDDVTSSTADTKSTNTGNTMVKK